MIVVVWRKLIVVLINGIIGIIELLSSMTRRQWVTLWELDYLKGWLGQEYIYLLMLVIEYVWILVNQIGFVNGYIVVEYLHLIGVW